MRRNLFLVIIMGALLGFGACSSDSSGNETEEPGTGSGKIDLSVTGRVGTLVGEDLTTYVKSLDLLLFRENVNGVYLLTQNVTYNKAQLEGLSAGTAEDGAGFTTSRTVDFEKLPLGTYIIVGVGNIRDSVGQVLEKAILSGVNIGNTMEQVIASVMADSVSPRLFFGSTQPVVLGSALPLAPSLTLFRKVSMFALTLENVPSAVKKIDVNIQNTYGAFDMTGSFLSNRVISVSQTNSYNFTSDQASLPVSLIALPTVSGQRSEFTLIFYLDNGQVINIPLPNTYVLKPNTITKLTATIDADQSGGQWRMDLSISISVDVEWNVDQEPGIII